MSFGEAQTRYEVKRTIRDRQHGDLRPGALPSPARVAKWNPDNVRAMLKIGYLAVYGGGKPCDPDPSPTLAGVISGQPVAACAIDRPPSASTPAAPETSKDKPRASVAIKRRQRRELAP